MPVRGCNVVVSLFSWLRDRCTQTFLTPAELLIFYAAQQDPKCVVPIRLLVIACAGSIPEELGGLNKLEVLRLDDNKLTGKGVGA